MFASSARPPYPLCSLPAACDLCVIDSADNSTPQDPSTQSNPCTWGGDGFIKVQSLSCSSHRTWASTQTRTPGFEDELALILNALAPSALIDEAMRRLLDALPRLSPANLAMIVAKTSAATRSSHPLAATRAGELLVEAVRVVKDVDALGIASTLLDRVCDTAHAFAARKFLKLLERSLELLPDSARFEIARQHIARPELSPASEMLERWHVAATICDSFAEPLGAIVAFLHPFLLDESKPARVKALEMMEMLLDRPDMRAGERTLMLNCLLAEADNKQLEGDEFARISYVETRIGIDMLEYGEVPLLMDTLLKMSVEGHEGSRLRATELAAELLPGMPERRKIDALLIVSGRRMDANPVVRGFANSSFQKLLQALPRQDRLAIMLNSGSRERGRA